MIRQTLTASTLKASRCGRSRRTINNQLSLITTFPRARYKVEFMALQNQRTDSSTDQQKPTFMHQTNEPPPVSPKSPSISQNTFNSKHTMPTHQQPESDEPQPTAKTEPQQELENDSPAMPQSSHQGTSPSVSNVDQPLGADHERNTPVNINSLRLFLRGAHEPIDEMEMVCYLSRP
jgi:hypothetical protein